MTLLILRGQRITTIEMSSAAFNRRLKQTEQARKLSLSLRQEKPLSEQRALELRRLFCERKARDAAHDGN